MKRLAWILLFVCGCTTLPQSQSSFPVELEVDFGPAAKPTIQETLQVTSGTTPEGLLAQAVPVAKGAICCDPREIAAIDGVAADPAANRWWTVSINGSKKGVSPYQTKLKSGDRVRWEYRQNDQ